MFWSEDDIMFRTWGVVRQGSCVSRSRTWLVPFAGANEREKPLRFSVQSP